METSPGNAPPVPTLAERRARALGPTYHLFYDDPVHVVRGEGLWLYDADGRRYLDMYNNVPSVGHCHPRVVAALGAAAARLNTHTRYLHEAVVELAESLLATMPAEIERVVFACTGSEANDLAVRVAKAATGGTGILVTANAYHGATETTAGLSPERGENGPVGRDVYTVPAPRSHRGHGTVGEDFAEGVVAALRRMRRDGVRPAALLFDTIFASDGIFSDPEGFVARAVAAVRDAGGLCIADEVQAGCGRTGTMWGFARHRLTPDLVTMGKPMGNGHPIAALAARSEPLERFARSVGYFNTFGGNTVSAAVGKSVLDVIAEERLIDNARRQGDRLRAGLDRLAARSSAVRDVRGAGLFVGVELSEERPTGAVPRDQAGAVVNALRQRGVLIGRTGPANHVLKIRPPLPIRAEEIDGFLAALEDSLRELSQGPARDAGG
jgi:4-aminobutyrate aminotransferase-like enzyme